MIAVMLIFFTGPLPTKVPTFHGLISNRSTTVYISHEGGDALQKGEFRILVDDVDETWNFTQSITGPFSMGKVMKATLPKMAKRVVMLHNSSWGGGTVLLAAEFAPTAPVVPPGWFSGDWLYRKKITVDHTKVSGTQADFPVLISLVSDTDLAADARDDGDDLLFTSSDGTTKLSHEIEGFSGSTGALTAWVKVPSLSSATDTVLYLYYGNPGSTSQQNRNGVWSNGFLEVWHLAETSGNVGDSTSNGYTGTVSGTVNRISGKIGGAMEFLGPSTTTYVTLADGNLGNNAPFTISAWFNVDTSTTWAGIVTKGRETGHDWVGLWANGKKYLFGWDWQSGKGGNVDGSTLSLDTWYYGTGTFDGTNRRLYLNSILDAGPSTGNYGGITGSSTSVANDRADASANTFDGMIDEVRISTGARSPEWIATEFSNQDNPGTFYSLGSEQTPGTMS